MEQQTPIPPPQIKDKAARRAKTRHFPILDLGGGGWGFAVPFYFVQDCSQIAAVFIIKRPVMFELTDRRIIIKVDSVWVMF